jgi:hypothetical protein
VVQETQKTVDEAVQTFRSLVIYFGENEVMTPLEFFSVIDKFVKSFSKAVDDNMQMLREKERQKLREERLRKKESQCDSKAIEEPSIAEGKEDIKPLNVQS